MLLPGDAPRIVLAGDQPPLQIAGQAVGAVSRLQQQRNALAGLVFHPAIIVDVAEHEIAAFVPPQWSLGRSLRPAKAVGQFLNRLRDFDDPVEFRR